MDRKQHKKSIIFLTLVSAIMPGCMERETDIVLHENVRVSNDESILNLRISNYHDTLAVEDEFGSGDRKGKAFELVLEKSLESPVVDGNRLQATSVFYNNGKLLVSYNYRGEKYAGGAEFLTEQFTLTSQILYDDADINAVTSDNEYVYLTGGVRGGEIPAQIMKVSLTGNKFDPEEIQSQVLGSYTGTALCHLGEHLYATTGNDETAGGGIYQLDSQLKVTGYLPLHDARWIVGYGDKLYIAQGTPGVLTVLYRDTFVEAFSFPFKGADVPASKTTIDVVDERIFIAGGTKGVQIHRASDGAFLHEVTFGEGNITNAVTADNGLLFISNGEGGLHVASYTADPSEEPELVGKIHFDENNESVNHVLHRNKNLYVATGLGGIKMISVKK